MATVKSPDAPPLREPADRWSIAEAGERYDVSRWGKGYFSVGNNGHLWVHPNKEPARGIDLKRFGGRRGDRTPDLCIANAALSQLS